MLCLLIFLTRFLFDCGLTAVRGCRSGEDSRWGLAREDSRTETGATAVAGTRVVIRFMPLLTLEHIFLLSVTKPFNDCASDIDRTIDIFGFSGIPSDFKLSISVASSDFRFAAALRSGIDLAVAAAVGSFIAFADSSLVLRASSDF